MVAGDKLQVSKQRVQRNRQLKHVIYICKLDPALCEQKENVLSLKSFGVTPREKCGKVFPDVFSVLVYNLLLFVFKFLTL